MSTTLAPAATTTTSSTDGRTALELTEGIVEDPAGLVGEPDGLERLWTPHRMVYIDGNNERKEDTEGEDADHSCPFCEAPKSSDEDSLIVFRGDTCYVILNLFPYNPGHLLICPYRHIASYMDITDEERKEMGDLTARAMKVAAASMSPNGFNLGMNQGAVAGAGIAEHLHQHVVPRWSGDANFFPIVARTKAVPVLLGDTRKQLADKWRQMYEGGKEVSNGSR